MYRDKISVVDLIRNFMGRSKLRKTNIRKLVPNLEQIFLELRYDSSFPYQVGIYYPKKAIKTLPARDDCSRPQEDGWSYRRLLIVN